MYVRCFFSVHREKELTRFFFVCLFVCFSPFSFLLPLPIRTFRFIFFLLSFHCFTINWLLFFFCCCVSRCLFEFHVSCSISLKNSFFFSVYNLYILYSLLLLLLLLLQYASLFHLWFILFLSLTHGLRVHCFFFVLVFSLFFFVLHWWWWRRRKQKALSFFFCLSFSFACILVQTKLCMCMWLFFALVYIEQQQQKKKKKNKKYIDYCFTPVFRAFIISLCCIQYTCGFCTLTPSLLSVCVFCSLGKK